MKRADTKKSSKEEWGLPCAFVQYTYTGTAYRLKNACVRIYGPSFREDKPKTLVFKE